MNPREEAAMPKYDYECRQCQERTELDVPYDLRDSGYECPYCGFDLDRIYSVPNIAFKGDGWTPKFHGGKS
jgi:putative FmdB family regulatory protein